ncbi:YeeE/YedE family protein [soil metagenome]
MVIKRVLIALLAGLLFGVGLAHSGMSDPARVHAFLDLFGGAWDPTLAFVMGGAIAPMAIAWLIRHQLDRPFADLCFFLPETTGITPELIGGSTLFGIGWGIAGLCPGPAVADLAIAPLPAAIFVIAMLGGMILQRLLLVILARQNLGKRYV